MKVQIAATILLAGTSDCWHLEARTGGTLQDVRYRGTELTAGAGMGKGNGRGIGTGTGRGRGLGTGRG